MISGYIGAHAAFGAAYGPWRNRLGYQAIAANLAVCNCLSPGPFSSRCRILAGLVSPPPPAGEAGTTPWPSRGHPCDGSL